MLKKVTSIIILLCLIFSISVMAENENSVNDGSAPVAGEQIPGEMKEPPRGGGENMGMPPSRDIKNQNIPPDMPNGEMPAEGNGQNSQFGGFPGGMGGFPGGMQGNNNQNQQAEQPTGVLGFVKTNSAPIASVVLLGLAFIFVIFYRRKNY